MIHKIIEYTFPGNCKIKSEFKNNHFKYYEIRIFLIFYEAIRKNSQVNYHKIKETKCINGN